MIIIINKNSDLEKYVVRPITKKYFTLSQPILRYNKLINIILLGFSVFKFFIIIKLFKVKVVITTIDNSSYFHKLSKLFNKINFYAIQNGIRSKRELIRPTKNHLTNFFCFGDYEKKTYKEFGHSAETFIPVGSFRLSIYLKDYSYIYLNSKISYDVCFISQLSDVYFRNIELLNSDQKILKSLTIDILLALKKISEKTNIKISIACRHGTNSIEYKYYNKLFNKNNITINARNDTFSTYKLVTQSKLIISIFSTVNLEALTFNKKILFIDSTEDNRYAYYDDDLCVYKNSNLKFLSKKINDILSMKNLEYKKRINKFSELLIRKDQYNIPTYKKIRNKIIKDNLIKQ